MSEQAATVSGIPAGLTIRADDRGQNAIADWLCACGHHQRATGARPVAALAARVVVGHCPHQEVKAA